ncbi:amino acid deaminase [Cellulomonas sp. NPDC058312]|uniref:amino acid deaminase n=1 Tax=Cellulomonas sp. NPDC058312 TaxID=3346441 RepID=UPI0036F14A28
MRPTDPPEPPATAATADADARALRDLDAAAAAAPHDPAAALDPRGPVGWLARQIDDDRARGGFGTWARSTVVDEHTREPVLDPPVLAWLQARAGLPVEHPGTDAGLAHVYGYLLSTAATPYGPKRERWTGGALAVALGHDPRHLLPWHRPDGRTLLERVTDAVLPLLRDPHVPGTLLVRDDPVPGTHDALRTVVHRGQGVVGEGGALLYGLVGPDGVRPVTVFPVTASPSWLRETGALPPVPRYNVLLD